MTAEFSLELPEEVVHVRDWVHEFAAEVIRPTASEWDEREETPWPIIAEAAKVGLYTPELFVQMAAEPSGIGMLSVFAETFWGDAGIALSILGTGLAAAALAASGTPEQLGEFLPQMFGSPGDPKVAAFCSSEPGAGSDIGAVRTRARYDEVADEWVLSGTKDMGDERRHRQRARRCRIRISRPGHPWPGDVRHPSRHPRALAGTEVQKTWNPRVAHR